MKIFKKAFLALLGLCTIVSLNACKGDEESSTTTAEFDKDAGYRDVTSSLSLTLAYEGKNYIDDGIGKVTLRKHTDGDTSTFTLNERSSTTGLSSVVLRYHGINTPESTIKVEKWGKTASNYTKSRLTNAYEIVLEATTTPASTESNERYLGYVWYRESATDTFKCLNLELVENGYAHYTTALTKYQDAFASALAFAKTHEMHLWGNDTDPNYSTAAIKVTLKELIEDLNSEDPTYYSYDEDSGEYNGAKVTFDAYIKSHTTSGTSTQHYYVAEVLGDDGKLYDINLYGGYSSQTINNWIFVGGLYHIVGTVQKYNDTYQISGLDFIINNNTENYTHLIEANYYTIFDSNYERFNLGSETAINGDLEVTSATVSGTTLTIVGQALEKTNSTDKTSFTIKVEVEAGFDPSSLVGKNISTYGYKNDDNSISVSYSNITIIS